MNRSLITSILYKDYLNFGKDTSKFKLFHKINLKVQEEIINLNFFQTVDSLEGKFIMAVKICLISAKY